MTLDIVIHFRPYEPLSSSNTIHGLLDTVLYFRPCEPLSSSNTIQGLLDTVIHFRLVNLYLAQAHFQDD